MGSPDTESWPPPDPDAAAVLLTTEPAPVPAPVPTTEALMRTGASPFAPGAGVLVAMPLGGEARSRTRRGGRSGGRSRGRFWRDLCIGGLLVSLTHIFLVQVSVVRGLSMSPSLHDGDRLMVDRISYSLANVSRFDVVVLRYPKNPDVDFVKRVVGLPGDRIEMRSGLLRVNGETVPERFGHVIDKNERGSWTVPAHAFFVLGDNRPISCDSREFGTVDRDLLKGKVRIIFWPPSRFAIF